MRVIFDVQHTGRPSRPGDMGAAYDLDGDGVRNEEGEREVDMTRAYVAAAVAVLACSGVPADVLDSGEYGERHRRADNIARGVNGPVVYVACHVNAGGGRYGLVLRDARSSGGEALARTLAVELRRLPELGDTRASTLSANDRGWACIDGIWQGPANLCGVLLEPFFLDSATHRALTKPAGLARVGGAIAAGCLAFLRERQARAA
jgi:hypothetical protein